MTRQSPTETDRPWLKESDMKRQQRSLELGKKAINMLVAMGVSVTLSAIQAASKEIDPAGKGIHSNTVKTNPELFECYKQYSKTYAKKHKMPPVQTNSGMQVDFMRIDPNRNLTLVRNRYSKFSKAELIGRLIAAEQFIADNHSKWTRNLFAQFTDNR
jgi:hypothetical protein